jgi:hypothetical protein
MDIPGGAVPKPGNLEVGRVLVPVRLRHHASLNEMLNFAEIHRGLTGTSECSLAAIITKTGFRTRQDTAAARGLCVRTRGRERGGEQLCWEGDGDVRGSNHAAHRPCITKVHIQLASFACVGLCNNK